MDPRRVLVIGYGNTLRGDDGIGPAVAEAVQRSVVGIDVRMMHQLTPELAEDLAHAEVAVFVDAADGQPPGTVRVIEVEGPPVARREGSHTVDPGWLIRITNVLYGRSPRAFAVLVGGMDFELDAGLSPAARQGVKEAHDRIVALLAEIGLPVMPPSPNDTENRGQGPPSRWSCYTPQPHLKGRSGDPATNNP